MSNRIEEIRARLDAATPGPWEWREWSCGDEAITGPDNTGFVVNVDEATPHADADLIANAPADIAWLLDQLTIQQADNKTDVEEIYALRDEVNALWDVIWDLAEESDIDDISKYFLKRLNIHKENRKGSLDIGNL